MANEIKLFDAIKRMRALTKVGVPFSFSFMTYNSTKGMSDGIRHVHNAQLRMGYRNDQSDKSNILIGYVNEHDKDRWFYMPLLLKFNGCNVKP
ncbi:hypothetical protein [Flavobacterium sp. 38-13]|uniref:hypothetical protein n=1 Tax=Flavobacterium sp. 38-13 TaxID=1896168 RepID=UPI000AE5AEEF|nr:hypothetical protein [Flavobacterium sp. 38-13]